MLLQTNEPKWRNKMARIYLGVYDTEVFEALISDYSLREISAESCGWGWEYLIEGDRSQIEAFLREEYCVGADDDGTFLRDTLREIEE